MVRLGLCCMFREAAIRFRRTTAAAMLRLERSAALARLAGICRGNAEALTAAIRYCGDHGIGDFRVNSQILPVKTHPEAGYTMAALPGGGEIISQFRACGALARELGVRLTFHPDQFVLLSSPDPAVTARSVADLAYHAEVAEWIGADVINIHGGGVYGDRASALERVARNLETLAPGIRQRLTLENDERSYAPADLLPLCTAAGVPLAYDVHHHRCKPDGLTVDEATERAAATWDREPVFHISSPLEGWDGPKPSRHHDFIDPADFPDCWQDLEVTVEVEAKAKELAVRRLADALAIGA